MSRVVTSLSVVLPAYNEAVVVERTIRSVVAYGRPRFVEFEVVVVDDGSTDETLAICQRLAAELPELLVVHRPHNGGYGEALRAGFGAARGQWVLLMDADGQFRIESLGELLPEVGSHDVVLGYRQRRADSWWRALATWGYVRVVRWLAGVRARDVGCGFKLFLRRTWQQVQPIESRDQKIFTVEWVAKLQATGVRMAEVPVRHWPRQGGMATGGRWDVTVRSLGALVRFGWRRRRAL